MNKVDSRSDLLGGIEKNLSALFLACAVSIICHLIFFVVLVIVPGYHTPKRKFFSSVINVSMVTLPAKGPAPGSRGQIALKPEKQVTERAKTPISRTMHKAGAKASIDVDRKPSKAVSLVTKKKKPKKSLKKKTFKSSRVVKSAITQIEKKVEESKPDPVAEAIGRLKNKVGKTEAKGVTGQGSGIQGVAGKRAKYALEQIDIYKLEIAYHIKKNWVFSEQLAGGRTDLEARLVIKIMANGDITDIWFEKRSGNSYLDESAYKAIKKSSPLPPLPKGNDSYDVLLGFTPKGLK